MYGGAMQNRTDKSLFGIDINEYTQGVDFAVLARTVDFLYLRSSGSASGRFRTDRKIIDFASKARNNGIPEGAYHFAVPSYDLNTADAQCDGFINVLQQGFGDGDYGDLFPVVDVETPTDKSISTTALINWIDRFRKRFEKKTRRRLMLYTGAFFIDEYNIFFVPGNAANAGGVSVSVLEMTQNSMKLSLSHYDVDEKLLDNEPPSLIFQPLVENALEHGLDIKEDPDHQIWFRIWEETDSGVIYVSIRDNGVGMDADTLAHVLE